MEFGFQFPKNVAKVEAIAAAADGVGFRTRPRQIGNKVVQRKIKVVGVVAQCSCPRVCDDLMEDVVEGKGKAAKKTGEKKVGERVSFEGVCTRPFKLAKGKASDVDKSPSIALELPDEFSGVVMISALVDGQPQLLKAIDVEPEPEVEAEE